jgi:hypothetical protein
MPSGLVALDISRLGEGRRNAAFDQRALHLAVGYGLNENPAEEEYRPPPDLVSVEP